MANDYSNIGFRIDEDTNLSALCSAYPEMITYRKNIYGEAVELFCPDGRAELWLYEDENGAFGSYVVPGYHSGRKTEVVLQKRLPDALVEVETAVCPLIIEAPDADLAPLEMGKLCLIELTLFAWNVTVYESADAFMEKHRGSTAPESIIPCGSFSLPENEEDFVPDATAQISGVVTDAVLRENPIYGGKYYEIGFSCLGVDFTVVADSELFQEAPQAGNIVQGVFWVSSRITDQ